jgi:hypothetical protein
LTIVSTRRSTLSGRARMSREPPTKMVVMR